MSTVDFLEFYAIVFIAFIYFGPGLISGLVAWKKGYRPWFWLASMGIIGMLVIFAIPMLAKARTPEEREQMEWRADWTGGILSGVTMLPLVIVVFFNLMFVVRAQTMALPPLRINATLTDPDATPGTRQVATPRQK